MPLIITIRCNIFTHHHMLQYFHPSPYVAILSPITITLYVAIFSPITTVFHCAVIFSLITIRWNISTYFHHHYIYHYFLHIVHQSPFVAIVSSISSLITICGQILTIFLTSLNPYAIFPTYYSLVTLCCNTPMIYFTNYYYILQNLRYSVRHFYTLLQLFSFHSRFALLIHFKSWINAYYFEDNWHVSTVVSDGTQLWCKMLFPRLIHTRVNFTLNVYVIFWLLFSNPVI